VESRTDRGDDDTMTPAEQMARAAKARELAETLPTRGVRALAVTMVDNCGVTRVKTVPISLLERTVRAGIGLSPVFDVFLVNDHITASDEVSGPTGDYRLMVDPNAIRVLSAQPGWAWGPADRLTQEGEVAAICQRSFLRKMIDRASAKGIELSVGCEIEWFLGREEDDGRLVAAHYGPAYSAVVLAQLSDYVSDLIAAFEDEGVGVDQFHPEYSNGQLEISLRHRDPLAAADLMVLARQTIRGVSEKHGWRASFSPTVVPGQVGNGGHWHFSTWRDGENQFAVGDGPYGMTGEAQSFVAGILAELPALLAVGCPSVASYLRLVPSAWAGVYQVWGRENREAAVRLVTGIVGTRDASSNAEVKTFDLSANPYLAIGALIAAGLAGVEQGLQLPAEFPDDPAGHPEEELEQLGVRRLPSSLSESVAHLEKSDVLREAMGSVLFGAFVAVRRAEIEAFESLEPDAIAAAHRWRY
jgi:glutamine synthetase